MQADKEKKVKKTKKKEEEPAPAPAPEPEPAPAPAPESVKKASTKASSGSSKRAAKRSGSNVFSMFSQTQVAEFKEVNIPLQLFVLKRFNTSIREPFFYNQTKN